MKTVYKYDLVVDDYTSIRAPHGAKVLSVACQRGRPFVWALVDTDEPMTIHRFCVRGTGHKMRGDEGEHVASFQMLDGDLVFHVFEEKR